MKSSFLGQWLEIPRALVLPFLCDQYVVDLHIYFVCVVFAVVCLLAKYDVFINACNPSCKENF